MMTIFRHIHNQNLWLLSIFIFTFALLTACGGDAEFSDSADSANGSEQGGDLAAEGRRGGGGNNASNGVLIQFRANATAAQRQNAMSSAGCRQNTRFTIVSGLSHANITGGQTVDQTLNNLRNNPAVEFAEPNYIVTTQDHVVPNDPQFGQLWGLNNVAQPGADISALDAWHTQTGTNVVVAVIDSGLDYNHPDLRNNVWINPNEIPNNNVDDDGNGYVDDVRGWDFVSNDNNPLDDNRHGTHVSGTIAAEGNNGIGVVGVSWRARIMPLKFMNSAGQGTTANAIRAIEYAVAMGAKISNNSWGGPGFSQALRNAISAANAAGHLFVAASGNSGNNSDFTPSYPAAYNLPNIISVAATNSSDNLANFSNFGVNSVDLGAPGTNILSTTPGNSYASLNGTSMAAPHVSGVAALLLSQNTNMNAADLKAAMMSTVDPIGALAGRTVSGGRVNAGQALASIAPVVNINVTPTTAQVEIGQTLAFSAGGGTGPYSWSVTNSTVASINAAGVLTGLNSGTVQVTASDANGDAGRSGIITVTIPTISVGPNNQSIPAGQSRQYSASGGSAPYTWTSSNNNVATVDTNGLVTALNGGSAQITATDTNGISGSAAVTVTQLNISPNTATAAIGQTVAFSATGGVPPYSWSVNNTAAASINASTGLLTAINIGSVIVSVTDNTGRTDVSGTITITDTPVATPQTALLAVGDNLQFNVAGGLAPYSWNSSNSAVASINANGLLSALSAGTTTITVTDAAGNAYNTGTISVRAVSISPQTQTVLLANTLLLTASGGSAPYTWSVSDTTIASVGANGLLTPLALGTVTVTATDADGFSATATINVTDVTIVVTPNAANVRQFRWQRFTASGGAAPYTFSLSNAAAGFINSGNGWFRATGPVGSTTTVIVTDVNGATVESGTVTVSCRRMRC